MFEVNGFLMDLRSALRALQEAAFAQGLVPYVPDAKSEEPARASEPASARRVTAVREGGEIVRCR